MEILKAPDSSSRKSFSVLKWYVQKVLSQWEMKCRGKPEAFYPISSPILTAMPPTCKLFSAFRFGVLSLQPRNFHTVLVPCSSPTEGQGTISNRHVSHKESTTCQLFHFRLSFHLLPGSIGNCAPFTRPRLVHGNHRLGHFHTDGKQASWPTEQDHRRRHDSFYLSPSFKGHKLKYISGILYEWQ